MSFKLFFDTADAVYIKTKWKLLSKYFDKAQFVGITTNPLAMSRENLSSLKEWEVKTKELCATVSEIRGDNYGVVYVQVPSDDLTETQVVEYAKMVEAWTDGETPVALKLPPYKKYLNMTKELSKTLDVNFTGVADCFTALNCLFEKPRYVSLIPGRMEEAGIDAVAHTKYYFNSQAGKGNPYAPSELITGSMRTLEQLKYCVEFGTVPTIGKTVLNLLDKTNLKEVSSWAKSKVVEDNYGKLPPVVDERNIKLSNDFFKQMNEVGLPIKNDFLNMI